MRQCATFFCLIVFYRQFLLSVCYIGHKCYAQLHLNCFNRSQKQADRDIFLWNRQRPKGGLKMGRDVILNKWWHTHKSCSIICFLLRFTVLCNTLDPPLVSLYFAREIGSRCGSLLKHANIHGFPCMYIVYMWKNRVCKVLISLKVNIRYDHSCSSTQPHCFNNTCVYFSIGMLFLH